MYTATPGTISHAVFVTCFALSMTTLAMGVTAEAAFLRLILSSPLDYWRLCDAQLQYHMVHAQIRKELPKSAKNDEGFYLDLLSITWRMASEIYLLHGSYLRSDTGNASFKKREISGKY